MQIKPKTGIKGLIENWQSDLIAAISVALIALPLSLGIALAAGAPAMSGIFSAVVGGIVTTLYRGGHISVN
jgi:MFS superfamily sulfate permease-like transporter